MASLDLELYPPEVTSGCCPGEYYALVFGTPTKALKDSGGATIPEETFFAADQDDFKFTLVEPAERTLYYALTIDDVVMPITPDGKHYYIEYWKQVGGSADRDADELLSVDKFLWTGNERDDNMPFGTSKYSNNQNLVQVSAYYNSSANSLTGLAWLELAGQVVTAPTSMSFDWRYETNSVIATGSGSLVLPTHGVFKFTVNSINLTPGMLTSIKSSIVYNSRTYSSGASYVVFD